MITISRQIALYFGILAGFVVTVQAFQGTFKAFWSGKHVRVSKTSKKFLAQIVPLQETLFFQVQEQAACLDNNTMKILLKLSDHWRCADCMKGADIEQFGQSMFKGSQKIITVNKNDFSAQGPSRKMLPSVVHTIASMLVQEIRNIGVATAKVDLDQIELFFQTLQEGTVCSASLKKNNVLMMSILQDIIQHFDGVSVTEYDFVVLSQSMIFVQLLSCFCFAG